MAVCVGRPRRRYAWMRRPHLKPSPAARKTRVVDEILSQIFRIVRGIEGRESAEVSGETTIADLQLDSMSVTQLLVELEGHFDLTLADDELDRVSTLSELASCILRHRAAAP